MPPTTTTTPTSSKRRCTLSRVLKLTVLCLLAAISIPLFVLCLIPDSPVQRSFTWFLSYVRSSTTSKSVGSVLFVLLYTISISLGLPGTPLNLAAGYIFGILLGTAVSAIGITLGAVLAFLLGRTLLRSWAESKVSSSPRFRAIDGAVRERGLLLIFLLRLSPVMPFGLCCYMLGATKVTTLVYTSATFAGLLPGTAAYTYLGTLMADLSSMWTNGSSEGQLQKVLWIVVGAVSTVILIVVVTFVAKRAIDREMKKQREAEGQGKGRDTKTTPDLKEEEEEEEEDEERAAGRGISTPEGEPSATSSDEVKTPLLAKAQAKEQEVGRLRQSRPGGRDGDEASLLE